MKKDHRGISLGTYVMLGVTGAALLIFALLYCAMYRLTSNAYYRIVSTQNV